MFMTTIDRRNVLIQPAEAAGVAAEWEHLDKQDWHLWMLAVLLMFVLGMSLLSFMFPSAYWFSDELAVRAPQRAFVGFCVLLALSLVYMLQRQRTIRRLKRDLYHARAFAAAAEDRASMQAYLSLPGNSQLRDSLAMDFLRASRSGETIALIIVETPNITQRALGAASNLLRSSLRHGESLFRISQSAFGLLMPGITASNTAAFGHLIEERLLQLVPDLRPAVTTAHYPTDVESLSEFESLLREVDHVSARRNCVSAAETAAV